MQGIFEEIKKGSLKGVKKCIDADDGAVLSKGDWGVTPLHLACSQGREDIVRLLLGRGAPINAQDCHGGSPLHLAVFENHTDIVRLLVLEGACVDIRDGFGTSPLTRAVEGGGDVIVRMLIRVDAHINQRDTFGDTPLHKAVFHGSLRTAQLLILEGADVTIKNNNAQTVREIRTTVRDSRILFSKIDHKASAEFPITLNKFITTCWHATPIHKACYENDLDGLCVLIGSISESELESLNALRDHHGWTALHVAAFLNRVEVVKLLMSKCSNAFLDRTKVNGHTSLHLACSRGHSEIVRFLIFIVV